MTAHCPESDRLHEYVLGASADADRHAIERHLAHCRSCSDELAALRRALDRLVHWPTDVTRPGRPLWNRVAERIGANASGPSARWREPAWECVAPGIECKILARDEAGSRVSMLVRLAPNTDYPPHRHAGVEELHLLEGELWIDERKLRPGDYNRAEPGTADKRVWSETGCTCVLITSPRDVLG